MKSSILHIALVFAIGVVNTGAFGAFPIRVLTFVRSFPNIGRSISNWLFLCNDGLHVFAGDFSADKLVGVVPELLTIARKFG